MEQHPESAVATAHPAPRSAASPPAEPREAKGAEPPPAPAETLDGAPPPSGYDPADYRWVPVRRRPRVDGWTEEKQRRFIEALADTGLVSAAAKAVGMARESAYKLRRSGHGAAFARAWDAARHHAGGVVEDVAFERAIEGVEHNVYDEYGEVVCTKRVYNDRLLMFLLRHLKPERYGGGAPAQDAVVEVEESLRAMEPPLPAPPEQLLGPETLTHELDLADAADGALPHFLSEQRPPKSAKRIAAEAQVAEEARCAAAYAKFERKEELTRKEFGDMCRHLDPIGSRERSGKRYR
ncbi:hypothetical protein [Sphingosinicella sp. LY1275]|uniref:hypothetical protein n=1 Tax=Sphingosinicella sp. LY1275 TaxID=3095379 RepID=UPI002ADECCBA|nr:hypothetical protein [Sphingosinicella sp. LY1275]MEA1015621.1 hypothetical protein [Sphingosinicella sp. LY1275]